MQRVQLINVLNMTDKICSAWVAGPWCPTFLVNIPSDPRAELSELLLLVVPGVDLTSHWSVSPGPGVGDAMSLVTGSPHPATLWSVLVTGVLRRVESLIFIQLESSGVRQCLGREQRHGWWRRGWLALQSWTRERRVYNLTCASSTSLIWCQQLILIYSPETTTNDPHTGHRQLQQSQFYVPVRVHFCPAQGQEWTGPAREESWSGASAAVTAVTTQELTAGHYHTRY